MDVPSPERCASLRAHKALPRRRVASEPKKLRQIFGHIERNVSEPESKKNEIASWIQGSSDALANPNQHLPLTPPTLPQDSKSHEAIEDANALSSNVEQPQIHPPSEKSTTPVDQRSPPTPDLTPPRNGANRPSLTALTTALHPSSRAESFKTTKEYSLRYPSSRAESFRTAREQLSSSDDEGAQRSSPLEMLAVPKARVKPLKLRSQEVGLGLALGSDGSVTPTGLGPKVVEQLETLPEPWAQEISIVNDDPFHIPEPAAVQEINLGKKPRLNHLDSPVDLGDGVSTPEDFQESLEKRLGLRDHKGGKQRSPTTDSIERFAAQIQWPAELNRRTPESDIPLVDSRRISQMSATSTIVEAFVVETPPQRRQRLRHSSKNASLRTASSPLSGSNRSSLVSNETRPRLHHMRNKLSDSNRMSLTSDSGVSMGSDRRRSYKETAELPDIPQRRSSLKSSSAARPRPENPVSKQLQSSSRPTTAPNGQASHIDKPQRKARAMSDSTPKPGLSDLRRGRTREFAPTIPTRTSSLSAPTSRNVSRTTSLTSTSLRKNLPQQESRHVSQRPHTPNQGPSKELVITIDNCERQNTEDLTDLLHRSLLTTTPFSVAPSMQSLTPGPYEVNEATAISIYPHNNNSLLVVQQKSRRDSDRPQISTRLTENVTISLKDRPRKPAASRPPQIVNSPLGNQTNQTDAPKAPAVMLIPPTPADEIQGVKASRSTRGRKPTVPPTGPLSTTRRAFSARRYAEAVAPLRRTLSRRNSTGGHRPALKTETNNKLSPFWRPRGFWDDFSDTESEPEYQDYFVRNTLGLPQRRVVAGPVALARRIGSLKRRKAQHDLSRYGTAAEERLRDTEKRVGILSRLQNTNHVSPLTKLYDAVERIRANRNEERLERQRARLKRNIGPVILQGDSKTFY